MRTNAACVPWSIVCLGCDQQARRQEMKWGCFVKKWKIGVCFFVKKWTFSQRRVHYVQYQYFLFYMLLIWGVHTRPTHPAAYGPVTMGPTKADKPIEVQLEAWTRVDPRNSQRHKWT